jgi:ectoine hydroxylase-related dioxygenase (phytanoyl-CoA dioxygenase family)
MTTQAGLPDIPDAAVEDYRRDGVVLLKGMFGQEWLDRIAASAERQLAVKEQASTTVMNDGPGNFFIGTVNWITDPLIKDIVFDSPAKYIAMKLMGSAGVKLLFDNLLVKAPGTPMETPWHQDLPYWPFAGEQICSIWIPADPVTRETGSMKYIKGSHLWGRSYRPVSFYENPAKDNRPDLNAALPPLPDIHSLADDDQIVSWDTEPGDCLVHHALVIHGAHGNSSPTRTRRALSLRWAGDDVTFHPNPGDTASPEQMEAMFNMKTGDPLNSPAFPTVVPA